MAAVAARLYAVWTSRERGAGAVEYGLVVALVAAVMVAVVAAFGQKLADVFSVVTDHL